MDTILVSGGEIVRSPAAVQKEPDRIFVRDDDIWTSAGITAGIDLALALVEEDLGPEVARHTAQQLDAGAGRRTC